MITLGGYGGYVTVGFDHTLRNAKDAKDFLVLGNAFENSSEPGIIQVAYDVNQNGQPDEEEWFEIAGSAHHDPKQETWYKRAKQAGNIVETYLDYSITYKNLLKNLRPMKKRKTISSGRTIKGIKDIR